MGGFNDYEPYIYICEKILSSLYTLMLQNAQEDRQGAGLIPREKKHNYWSALSEQTKRYNFEFREEGGGKRNSCLAQRKRYRTWSLSRQPKQVNVDMLKIVLINGAHPLTVIHTQKFPCYRYFLSKKHQTFIDKKKKTAWLDESERV